MTRINVVPVQELHDKHLVAEYREIHRVFKLARKCKDAPKQYVLGTGHVKFFYDKLFFIAKRQKELYVEMKHRGFKPNLTPLIDQEGENMISKVLADKWALWNDYVPTKEALELNRKRIAERLTDMYGQKKLKQMYEEQLMDT